MKEAMGAADALGGTLLEVSVRAEQPSLYCRDGIRRGPRVTLIHRELEADRGRALLSAMYAFPPGVHSRLTVACVLLLNSLIVSVG